MSMTGGMLSSLVSSFVFCAVNLVGKAKSEDVVEARGKERADFFWAIYVPLEMFPCKALGVMPFSNINKHSESS